MKSIREIGQRIWKRRAVLIGFADVMSVAVAYFFALLLRFDFRFSAIEERFLEGYQSSILIWCAITVVVFLICRLYHSIWRQASVAEMKSIIFLMVSLLQPFL